MDTEENDVRFCLQKILKLLFETGVRLSIRHPFISSFLLLSFILYVSFPSVFSALVHLFPLVICIAVVVAHAFFKKREGNNNGAQADDRNTKSEAGDHPHLDNGNKLVKRPITRVHSVRRRRARDLWKDDDAQPKMEDENPISSTNFDHDQMVDKNAFKEKSPKDIREVEVDHFQEDNNIYNNNANFAGPSTMSSPRQVSKDEPSHEGYRIKGLEAFRIEKAKDANEDDQKNVTMDVGAEGNKRLENLMARRRSRNLWSVNVRRALMNMDKKDHQGPFAPVVIPKHNTTFNNPSEPFPPVPGSAPSILVPMRNPFDLPYDPQEEKPDLTDDGFQQEFMPSSNKPDPVYYRHVSFNLGELSPAEFHQKGDQTSLNYGLGFGRRDSSQRYRFSRAGNEFDREIPQKIEEESREEPKSKPSIDTHDGEDHIKEMIPEEDTNNRDQVTESRYKQDTTDDVQEAKPNPNPEEDIVASSTSSPTSSVEDGHIYYKLDKETILKSLSNVARRYQAIEETDNNNKEHLSGRHYNDKNLPHDTNPSDSVASDKQVEVSEASSPPHAIKGATIMTSNHGKVDDELKNSVNGDSRVFSPRNRPSSPTQNGTEHQVSKTTISEDTKTSPNDGDQDTATDQQPSNDTSVTSEGSTGNFSVAMQENEQQS